MGALPRIEHIGVLVLENRFFHCRAGRMLACPGTVSNKACEARFPDCPERQRGDSAPQAAKAVA
jgi:hypothetical protein